LILDSISYRILTVKPWVIYTWLGIMGGLNFIVLLSGQYTTELYYMAMVNLSLPVCAYIGIQWYKKKYNFI